MKFIFFSANIKQKKQRVHDRSIVLYKTMYSIVQSDILCFIYDSILEFKSIYAEQ